jgi:hypothetical protein
MLENSFYTNNNVDKQVFNATGTNNVVPYVVGQAALGGVIAYILQPGDPGYKDNLQQGYVAASSDQAASVWGGSGTSTGATAQAIGTGQANTTAILAATAERPIAASVAAAVTDGGYTDWYLPSLEELRRLYANRALIGGFNTSGVLYWSSSEQSSTTSFTVNFNSGVTFSRNKTESNQVRAIRSFSVDITANPWQTWSKPEGRSMAYIVCIGGGGAGGGGASFPGGVSNVRVGGAGGGSASITIAQVPFYSIPDTLYVQVGIGGIGGINGNPGTTGGNGGLSYVSCYPTTDMFNCLVLANAGGGGGGGFSLFAGTGAAGLGGAALSSSSTTNPRYLSLCNWASYAGAAGNPGNSSNTPITIAANSITCPGTRGGIVAGPSGSQAGVAIVSGDTLTSFLKGYQSAAFQGISNGYSYLKPFLFTGGAGGSSNGAATGVDGGFGTIGSGGGGGGGGVTGGNGGNGGNGLVMIISY